MSIEQPADIGIPCPTAPARIWLQVDPEPEDREKPVFPSDPHSGDITWCADKINDTDTCYIRADLALCAVPAPPVGDAPADPAKERMADALQQISDWAGAYPLSVFPEPDFARAHEVLQAAGMTLDAISSSNMRHVITRVQAIADAALLEVKP